ncbi:L-threonine 3-dehydrogenase [Coprothermobacter proteolyticus DSM 5265]|uniref:L-threonine 3-dehydrogenase n=1 Tax=Coprothermobacter proteolyticus (strain ATCC 35245 / DSM 5265 / OCM 4 / BT) TaxID=309798 RepID=B5Y9P8_COPPD|nr:L-threonine 3-dehydrogenase [Coprothermobacter proteolyticus]ACI16985.1 L-threonine 3-dehydrogenase [Coprothermobacter proteolyticus DSM 5265]
MLAIRKGSATKGVAMYEIDEPEPPEGWALVKVLKASICGTDVHIYQWNEWSQKRMKPPVTIGHEFVGEVLKVNKGSGRVHEGDIVSAESHVVCHVCRMCRRNMYHACENTKIIGVHMDGAFAEYIAIPEENLVKLPPSVPLEAGSVLEPFGNAVHTVQAVDVRGKRVVVTGVGPIGVMAIPVAKALGAVQIVATDLSDYRLKLASEVGADVVINVKEQDPVKVVQDLGGADVVLEMSGSEKALNQGLEMIIPGGEMAILGLPDNRVSLDLANDVVSKGITIKGITGRRLWETWDLGVSLVSSGKVDLKKVITHQFDFKDYEEAFSTMMSGNSGKVVLNISQ